MSSLRQPYKQRDNRFEIEFDEPNIILNIYNFMYIGVHHNTIIADPNRLISDSYKSGIMRVFTTSADTYGEPGSQEPTSYACPGPITTDDCGRSYMINLTIASQKRHLKLVSSMLDTWP